MPRRFANVSCLVFALVSSGCALSRGSVTRITNGVEAEGRAVSAEAYAYYARGVVLERSGDAAGAVTAFRAALREDPDSAELNARLGSAECSRSQGAGDAHALAAEEHLKRAAELDPESSNVWALTARCADHRARWHEALDAARKAASFDPDSVYLSLLVIQYAEALSDLDTARRWLDGLLVRAPSSREALKVMLNFAGRHSDRVRFARAERGLRELGLPIDPAVQFAEVLQRGDLAAARRLATERRQSPAELAIAAVVEGPPAMALEQAELVLAADPNDANAWIAALTAADLARDRKRIERLASEDPVAPSTPNPLALDLLGETLARLVGEDARAAWYPSKAPPTEKDH